MKTQGLYCIYTSFSYWFHIVLFGDCFQKLSFQSFSCRCKLKTQRKVCGSDENDIKTHSCKRCVDAICTIVAFLLKTISFSMKTYNFIIINYNYRRMHSCRRGLNLHLPQINVKRCTENTN